MNCRLFPFKVESCWSNNSETKNTFWISYRVPICSLLVFINWTICCHFSFHTVLISKEKYHNVKEFLCETFIFRLLIVYEFLSYLMITSFHRKVPYNFYHNGINWVIKSTFTLEIVKYSVCYKKVQCAHNNCVSVWKFHRVKCKLKIHKNHARFDISTNHMQC